MLTGKNLDLQINIREVYRYLGYKEREPEPEIKEKIAACIDDVISASELRGLYEKFPLEFSNEEGEFQIGGIHVSSKNLWKNLWGCSYVYLLGATIGIGVDRLITRASVSDITKATIYQAVGAAYIEDYVDSINEEIRQIACREGMVLKPRFSPGYGDLTLEYQKDIFRLLNLSKHVGISLSESMLMSPSKSVTAIIGVKIQEEGEESVRSQKKKCSACTMRDCAYRER